MAKLKATRSILHQNRLYGAGEELPTYDAALVNAWLEAKSAVWHKEQSEAVKAAKQPETTPGAASETKQASQPTRNGKKKAPKQ